MNTVFNLQRIPNLKYNLVAKLTWRRSKSDPITNEDLEVLVAEYTDIHKRACSLEHQLITALSENTRLTHENEFMIRMLNERDS